MNYGFPSEILIMPASNLVDVNVMDEQRLSCDARHRCPLVLILLTESLSTVQIFGLCSYNHMTVHIYTGTTM